MDFESQETFFHSNENLWKEKGKRGGGSTLISVPLHTYLPTTFPNLLFTMAMADL